jgi:hypothetical protein
MNVYIKGARTAKTPIPINSTTLPMVGIGNLSDKPTDERAWDERNHKNHSPNKKHHLDHYFFYSQPAVR